MSQENLLQPAEYVTDVAYERSFIHQLTPSSLRLVAALNGITPPPEDDFDYLELGSGHGDTLVALAAANPKARFVGVDMNPEHVAFATELARRGGVGNVRFLECDFEAIESQGLPAFDFIAAHGVLTWISAAKQTAVLEVARKKLKPGGLFYVSYNALPGWAAIEPLRRLMLESSLGFEGSTLDRAREGFAAVMRLAEVNAAYISSHPTARSMLSLIQKAGMSYAVHEYFNAHWRPMYFADLAREMATHDLTFAGQLPLAFNVQELALPPAAKALARTAKDRIAYETMKDFALNEFFRSDVFVKTSVVPSQQALHAVFDTTRFGTTVMSAQIKRSAKLPVYSLDYTGPVYDAILAEIATRSATATELAQSPKLAELGARRIGDCLQNLCLGGQVAPMRQLPVPAAHEGATSYRIPLPFNRMILEDALVEGGGASLRVLASPATGAGVSVTLLELVLLHLVTNLDSGARTGWLRKFSHRKPGLTIGDRVVEGEELVRLLTREVETLPVKVLPKLIELGIVEPA